MKIKMGSEIKSGEMVIMKEEFYNAPIPTGMRVGFRMDIGQTNFPIGVVVDDTIKEGVAYLRDQGSFVIKD